MSAILLSAAAAVRRCTAGCPSGQRERSVKPSAQPTLVRTQHLPPPAKMARWLRILVAGGPFFSVPACVILERCRPSCRGVHGRIADGIGAPGRSVCTVGCFTDGHGRAALALCFRLGGLPIRARIPGVGLGPVNFPGAGWLGRRRDNGGVWLAVAWRRRAAQSAGRSADVRVGRYGRAGRGPGRSHRLEGDGHAPATPPRLNAAGFCGRDACGVPVLQQLAEEQNAEYFAAVIWAGRLVEAPDRPVLRLAWAGLRIQRELSGCSGFIDRLQGSAGIDADGSIHCRWCG
jgi:hypothetical protein